MGVSGRPARQNQNLPRHLGLVHRAVEGEETLLVKGEDVGRLPQCRQQDFHQHLGVETDEHEVVVVVGLEVPEADLGRLVTMTRDAAASGRYLGSASRVGLAAAASKSAVIRTRSARLNTTDSSSWPPDGSEAQRAAVGTRCALRAEVYRLGALWNA